ncbi:monosaccharide ABC transporter membrane protein (CUT2 family) [Pseudonocardia hierapolitana]|uniref:Monosaccharide ABC transporter membrane protein (CUT2 family) n=1 Tax=Pseudonocardia hierapolitana TaxID=1128676 RepID=A0A561SJE2_9PSEU|nr:ABC transporter permease [Pseudonocardia hierapolitana]TWF74975.1 monosaccharide ABC transporter membrane protein (CUT2 family) [Pseudonocardia hierapolitana]
MIATSTGSPPRAITRLRGAVKPAVFGQLAALPAILIAVLVGSQLNRAFLTVDNIMTNVLAASAVLGVLTVAAALIIIAGHFDMSTQSVVAFAPVLSVWLVVPAAAGGAGVELDPVLGALLIFVLGGLVGAVNGFLVATLKLNAFIVTLAMLILLQGMTLGIGGGETLSNLPDVFIFLGSTRYLGVPAEVLIAVAVFVGAGLFMRYTVTGRQIYAIGGNPEAARASGIRVERITFWLFVASGALAGLAGLLMTARIASVTASQGNNILFTVFAAAVIGGIDLRGGRGRIVGVATGVLLLALVQNILLVSQIPSFWVNAIYGAIILLALMTGALAQGSWFARVRRPAAANHRSGDER